MMKKAILSMIAEVLIGIAFIIVASCINESNPAPIPVKEPVFAITGFYPSSGIVGSSVIVYGDQFIPTVPADKGTGPFVNTSIIAFNGIVAQAEYAYQDSIGKQSVSTKVPAGATIGKITATANGKTVSSLNDFIISVPIYLPNVNVSTVLGGWGLDVAIDSKGNFYFTHKEPNEIVKITPDGNKFILWSSKTGEIPYKIAVDANGNTYATVDTYVLKIDTDGKVSTLAGSNEFGDKDGQGSSARFRWLRGIAVDNSGNVYVADGENHKIRKITVNGTVSTLAGSTKGFKDGTGTNAQFAGPIDVTLDAEGNVYVADGFRIRKVSSAGQVSTIAGSKPGYLDGTTNDAQFNGITCIEIDSKGNLYLGDVGWGTTVVRRIASDGTVVTVAGSFPGNSDGAGSSAQFSFLGGIAINESGAIYMVQGSDSGPMRKIVIN